MFQLPIALAVEPRLLPYAEANGFRIDPKVLDTNVIVGCDSQPYNQYRDFIFRKMFEKQSLSTADRSEEIVSNVRELKRLDSRY